MGEIKVEQEARQAGKTEKQREDPRVCRQCHKVNTLDQWYELPRVFHLVCSTCATDNPYARPIQINTIADRYLEAITVLESLKQENDTLQDLAEHGPELGKQIRRLVRAVERQAKATEQLDGHVLELVENLSPRWLFHVEPEQKDAARKLMVRLSQEAGPGAILEVSEEEHRLLQGMVKL